MKPVPQLEAAKGKGRKCIYNAETNRLYCSNLIAVPFMFKMNFRDVVEIEDLMIRASLIFLDNDMQSDPVLRCVSCSSTEEKVTDDGRENKTKSFI